MKKFLMLFLLLGAFTLQAAAQKFALVDMEYIMGNIPAYERANEQLNQVSKKWQAEVEAKDTEAKTLYKKYQSESVFLSAEQKKEREQAIVRIEEEIFWSRGRIIQETRKPYSPYSGRYLQCDQVHRRSARLPIDFGSRQ